MKLTRPIVKHGKKLLVCADWIYRSSTFMCVDTSLTHIKWNVKSPEGSTWSTPRPYVYDDRIFLGNSSGRVYEYSLDGQLIQSTQVGGVIRGIRLVDDVLYVGDQSGKLYAIKR